MNEDKKTLGLNFANVSGIERGLFLQFVGLHPSLRAKDEGDGIRVYHFPEFDDVEGNPPRNLCMNMWVRGKPEDNGGKHLAYFPVSIGLPYRQAKFMANREKSDGSWGVVTQELAFWQEVVGTSDFVNMLQMLYAPKEGGISYKTYGGHGSTKRSQNDARREQLFEVMGDCFELEWECWSCNVNCFFDFRGEPKTERKSPYTVFNEEGE